jgi:predicted phage baseplate assembly protein
MTALRALDDCGSCDGLGPETPVRIENPPAQPEIAYRVGTHARFKATMLAALSAASRPPLGSLNTREDDDFSIGLIDAWAMVGDVLTFYQERAANEAFLRTATERGSVLELARLIGYEPRPGVAASAYVAFELETATGAPAQAVIPAGTQVQSVPGADEKPQIYETSEETITRPEWNAIRPRLLQPQKVGRKSRGFTVVGVGLSIERGDLVLLVTDTKQRDLRTVLRVSEDALSGTTRLQVGSPEPKPQKFRPGPAGSIAQVDPAPKPLDDATVRQDVLGKTWISGDLAAQAAARYWPLDELTRIVRELLATQPARASVELHRFRDRAGMFGHNAPKWDSLPGGLRFGQWLKNEDNVNTTWVPAAYPTSWEGRTLAEEALRRACLYLDSTRPKWTAGGMIALVSAATRRPYAIEENVELSLAKFTINGKATRLRLDSDKGLKVFTIRGTTIHGESERLELAPVPIPNPVAGSRIELDGFYLGLEPGRRAIVTGEPVNQPGVVAREVVTLSSITIVHGRTVLQLAQALEQTYVRTSVTINANVSLATHGASKEEVLGSGDATQAYQRFKLRQPPLTYVSAPTPSGGETTLRVYVDDVRWHEVPSLYGQGSRDRVYIARHESDGGTTVEFGDGRTGARLPTGPENVVARYRKGIGLEGLVRPDQLTLPLTRPLGVRTMTNPLPAEGADDPEPLEAARANAPTTVLTLDRVVSLQDYESFSQAFSGIAKALATRIWDPSGSFVLLTLAGPNGAVIDPEGHLADNLRTAIVELGDVGVRFRIAAFRPVPFQLTAKVKVDPDRLPERVIAAATRALQERFSFEARTFGQPVSQSEVEAAIQGVDGVVAVDLDKLFRTDAPLPVLSPRIFATVPASGDVPLLGAELLTLDPRRLDLKVMP